MIPIIAFTFSLFFCGLAVAEKAPQLVLENIDGTTFSLDEARKKGPVVFDFWATWCKPCIKGLPKIQALSKKYAEHGVQVLTINIDGPRNLPKVRPFMQRHNLELPVLLDHTNEILKQFHLAGVPATLIIASDGEVFYKHTDYRAGDEKNLRAKLDELLAIEKAKLDEIEDTKKER